MTQFAVYRNPNPDTRAQYPLLLDVQSDLVADLATHVVVPLCPASAMKGKLLDTLTPVFEIERRQFAMLTPQLAGIPKTLLGARVTDLARHRDEIIAALDLLITGIWAGLDTLCSDAWRYTMTHEITSEAALRALTGEPVHALVLAKSTPLITAPLRQFIERSPFVCLATVGRDGTCDISPRGDPPGFVSFIDEKTLFLPERPGNKRLDSVINIIERAQLSLLFMIPGTLETLRVNGRGTVTTDPELLSRCTVNGKAPEFGILVAVEEAFGHCSKALRRSRLWEADYVACDGVPTLAEMMAGHLGMDEPMKCELDQAIELDARTRMY